jgi:hypothetical protein
MNLVEMFKVTNLNPYLVAFSSKPLVMILEFMHEYLHSIKILIVAKYTCYKQVLHVR